MRFFSGLFRGRDAPVNKTAGSAYSFFLGTSASGKRVNERSAMQMTAVYSCVRILSEAVASLPLQFYRYTDTGGKEKAVDHPLYGQIRADLIINNRLDVEEFVERMDRYKAQPLKVLTGDYHYHTVTAESEKNLDFIEQELRKKGYLKEE